MSTPNTQNFSHEASVAAEPTMQSATTTPKIADAAHRAVDNAAARLAEAEAKLRAEAAGKEQTLREAADTATTKASELRDKTQDFINKNPLAAAGIAFTAGILFSAWMRR